MYLSYKIKIINSFQIKRIQKNAFEDLTFIDIVNLSLNVKLYANKPTSPCLSVYWKINLPLRVYPCTERLELISKFRQHSDQLEDRSS